MPTKVQVRTKLTSYEIYKYDNFKRDVVVFWIENKRLVVCLNMCDRKIKLADGSCQLCFSWKETG